MDLASLVAPLQEPAFTLWSVPVTWAEVFGDLTGLLCVWWTARQNIWSWPVGLVNNILFFLLFWSAKLYADASLQGIFFGLGVYGWWRWATPGPERDVLRVRHLTLPEWLVLGVLAVGGIAAVASWLASHTDSPAPLADAAVLVISLVATYGQAVKALESWYLWIAVDVISVPLYVSRSLYPTALLYALFGCLCVKGLLNWRRSLAATQPREVPA